jgi:hypothetical protein
MLIIPTTSLDCYFLSLEASKLRVVQKKQATEVKRVKAKKEAHQILVDGFFAAFVV